VRLVKEKNIFTTETQRAEVRGQKSENREQRKEKLISAPSVSLW
jgi:hypothetical protein